MNTPLPEGKARGKSPSLAGLRSLFKKAKSPELPERTSGKGSPSLAALLSFVWPGLGQLYAGKRRIAAIFAVPVLLVLLLLAYALRRGPVILAVQLFADRAVGLITLAIIIVVGVWRLVSVVHAYTRPGLSHSHRVIDRAVVAVLVVAIVVSHASAGYLLALSSNAGSQVFNSIADSSLIDQPTVAPSDSASMASSTPDPTLPPPLIDGRVTILLTGVDSDPTRSEHLYDTIMVVSYDSHTNSVQMVSVPRDSASFPFYFGGVDKASVRINSLPTYVRNGWIKSPDSPYLTLVKEVSYLVGIPINYYAVMDFVGFSKMIDAVGGIDVNNPKVVNDPTYVLAPNKFGFYLAAGTQHLDSMHALAYVRSRHGSSDWSRSARQQLVLQALARKMAQPNELLALPSIISAVGKSVVTTFPSEKLADYVSIAMAVPSKNFSSVVLGPPYTITGINSLNSASTTCLINYRVAALSIKLFGKDSLWYGKRTPANTCPAN
jgi:LCP family protein required for cell wall assembly